MPVVSRKRQRRRPESLFRGVNRFSDLLYDVRDLMKEQRYIDLAAAAQNLSNAVSPPNVPSGSHECLEGLVIASIS